MAPTLNCCSPGFRVTQYGRRCQWLKDEAFLKDLEGDSVDTEILDEELRQLQEEEPKTYVLFTEQIVWLFIQIDTVII